MLPRFAKGKFHPKNQEKYIGLKTPTYRSSWEHAFMRLCDEHPNVYQWASESIKIPYRHPISGKYTIYVPDFFIVYVDKNGKKHAEIIDNAYAYNIFDIISSKKSVKDEMNANKLFSTFKNLASL